MKKLLKIFASLLLGISIVVFLYTVSGELTHRANNFIRLLPPHAVSVKKIVDLKYNSYYIAGGTASHIYLGNFSDPEHLLVLNRFSIDTQQVRIKMPNWLKLVAPHLKVDSPYVYITDWGNGHILHATLEKPEAQSYNEDNTFFAEATPISPNSFVIRTLKTQSHEYILAKKAMHPLSIEYSPGLLQKQIDGLFDEDGILSYDRQLGILVYVYFYRNQYICMDTSLHLLYRGKTIDTIAHAHLKVAEINSNNTLVLASPPLLVNKKSSVYGNWLFVNSQLMANNENAKMFHESSVIDVYDLKGRNYKLSFYISDYNNSKFSDFKVFNNDIAVINDHYLLLYQPNPKYFH